MTKKSWPAWWYDPRTGEGRIFEQRNDVPKNWTEDPYYRSPDGAGDGNGYATVEEIRAALEAGTITTDEVEAAENLRDKPRVTVLNMVKKIREDIAKTAEERKAEQDALLSREEAIAEVRSAGIEIADDATDAEIEKALAGLEE